MTEFEGRAGQEHGVLRFGGCNPRRVGAAAILSLEEE
jgi:hypothetical protein